MKKFVKKVHVSSEMPNHLLNMKFDDWKRSMNSKAKSGTLSERKVRGCRSLRLCKSYISTEQFKNIYHGEKDENVKEAA